MVTQRSARTVPWDPLQDGHSGPLATSLSGPEHRPRPLLSVGDLMTPNPAVLGPDDDLANLYDLMDTKHVRHVPVVDGDGDLVGLVTHRDLLRCALAEETDYPLSLQCELLARKQVGEIMTADPETTEADADIRAAAQTMFENKYGCLPVVEGTRLVGILTEADFVRYLADRELDPR
jgi:CBS domain-containing membrane protein